MRKALIVGINDYPNCPLYGCEKDAIEISNVLEKHGDGSPNFQNKLFLSKDLPDTKALRRYINELFQGEADVALLYFSGHGYVNAIDGYLVTPDFTEYNEGVSMSEILAIALNSKIKDKIILLDCCYSGKFGVPNFDQKDYSIIGEGFTILTACRKDETAVEKSGQGIFTSLLLDALQGGASDLIGNISPGSLYSYVDEALGAWEQRPIFKTNVSKFISIRNVTPPIELVKLRKIVEYFPTPESMHKLNPSYEDTELNHNENNVKIFKDLQKFVSVRLVVPVGAEHMYFAAMNSKSCRLTALGYQYWRLVNEGKI